MKCHWLRDQRGSVLLFTTVLIVFLLVMGGIAIDLTYLGAAKGELQRSMDAASLAGAGNLGFDDTVFPTVRQEAWRFGNLNPYRVGTINLNLNAANAANGDIVLGIWDADARSFTPSLDGTRVNAVQCQYATQIPTSFLRLLGFNTLPVAAEAIAINPNTVVSTRFLVDSEMIDSDIPAIEDLAAELGIPPEDLISDLDGDWFIDIPPGEVLELPTGQVGDAALFDIAHPAYPFSPLNGSSSYSHENFLNWNEDSSSWRYTEVPLEMLDPLLGVSAAEDPNVYPSFVNPNFIHVSPVYKSDTSVLNRVLTPSSPVDGIPAVNALGLRRGLLAFKIIAMGSDPDGPGGSVLPNLVIQVVDPSTVVSLDQIVPYTRRRRLVR